MWVKSMGFCVRCRALTVHYLLVLFHLSEGRPTKLSAGSSFPGADSPYAGDASIPVFGIECAEVTVVRDANLTEYGEIITAPYTPPSCSNWSQAVLRLNGAVRGVQFDRFGAVWLGGVEILRLTTPEPTPTGIVWEVYRDITSVSPVLAKPGNMTLQIPNVVDKTYTGALQVNVTIQFYCFDSPRSLSLDKYVRPLKSWARPNIFQTAVNGNQSQNNSLSGLPRNMVHATLEVFASGHGCEEFWYTNLPDADTPAGGCGSGAYREIEVYVDGLVAGATYPFPVIYTGGVNPLLWRPLTGIASFNVPPYVFDLSPFLGVLNDGKDHNITLAVRHNNKAGVWYLDAVLHADLDPSVQVLTGEVLHHADHRPSIDTARTRSNNVTVYITEGQRQIKTVGWIAHPKLGKMTFSTGHALVASNNNTLVGAPLQVSRGTMYSERTFQRWSGDYNVTDPVSTVIHQEKFPYYVSDNSTQNANTFQIGPTQVNYSRHVSIQIMENQQAAFQIDMSNKINATALYNRSLTNHSLVYKERGTSEEASDLHVGPATVPCYSRRLTAADGYTTSKHNTSEACNWRAVPMGIYACGLTFCKQFDGRGRAARSFLPTVSLNTAKPSRDDIFIIL